MWTTDRSGWSGAVRWRAPLQRTVAWLLPAAAAVCVMGALWIAMPRAIGRLEIADERLQALQWWTLVP